MDLVQKFSTELADLHSSGPPVLEDLRAMMLACQRMGYLVAICTSDDRAGTDLAIKSWGIDTVVDVSVDFSDFLSLAQLKNTNAKIRIESFFIVVDY